MNNKSVIIVTKNQNQYRTYHISGNKAEHIFISECSRSFEITRTKMIAGGAEIPSYVKNYPSYYVLVGLPIMATPKDDNSEGCIILTSKLNIEFYTYD